MSDLVLSKKVNPVQKADSILETLNARIGFVSDLQKNQIQKQVSQEYLAYLSQLPDSQTPLSLAQYIDRVFIPKLQEQSEWSHSDKYFSEYLEKPIGKCLQSLYNQALHWTQPRSKKETDSWFTSALNRYLINTNQNIQFSYGFMKGGYSFGVRPAFELLFGLVDLLKRQALNIEKFPEIRAKLQDSSDQIYQSLGSFSGQKEDESQFQLDLNRQMNQMAQAVADAMVKRWKKAQQEGREAELLGEWTATGLIIVDGVAATAKLVTALPKLAKATARLPEILKRILGSRLPSQFEFEIQQIARSKEFLNLPPGPVPQPLLKSPVHPPTFELGFEFNMVENPGPLIQINQAAAGTFRSGMYNVKVLEEDVFLYRLGKAGGGRNAFGQYFTSRPTTYIEGRIDLAVKPQWIDPGTGVLTGTSPLESLYMLKIPKGTTVYEGPAGFQSGLYIGGETQIFVPEPWKIKGVDVISETPLFKKGAR